MLGISEDPTTYKKNLNKNKRKRKGVHFNEDEIVINPEDVDPNIGRFRNLIQSTVVPVATKKFKMEGSNIGIPANISPSKIFQSHMPSLYQGIDDDDQSNENKSSSISFDMDATSTIGSKLGLLLPNPAPDVNLNASTSAMNPGFPNKVTPKSLEKMDTEDEPKKKKYAKEQWPGRKPLNFTGV